MPDYNFKNNLKSTLQAKLWSDATSINCNHVVESADANTRRNAWPDFPFTLTLVDTANDSIEVIKCTGLASNSDNLIAFTCARAQENTTAQTFEIATTSVEHRLTSEALNSITNAVSPATTTARGIGRVATGADLVDGAPISNGPAFLAAGVHTSVAAAAGKVPVANTSGKVPEWAFDVGDLMPAFSTAKSGFLLCNGGAYSRTTYAALFAILGTSFGAGDGSTTFNVPDFRRRTIQGANANLKAVLAAGLPAITGTARVFHPSDGTASGAFAVTNLSGGSIVGSSASNLAFDLSFDASRSSSIFGASTTVQPPAIAANIFIKY